LASRACFNNVERGQRLAQLAAEAADAPSPRAALRQLGELRRELDAFERRQVARALADGASFAAVARDLGISRQAVHRRFRDLAAKDLPLLTAPEVPRVLQYAREEAASLGGGDLRSEHVLLAVLRAADLPAAERLRAAGVSLERARIHVEGTSPRIKLFKREPAADDLRALLEAPARAARARRGGRIEVEDLLLGALEDGDGGAVRTLRALGVEPEAMRDELAAAVRRRHRLGRT
jgi:ATP-dependent Clp protease ATP-binding subunit ClpA